MAIPSPLARPRVSTPDEPEGSVRHPALAVAGLSVAVVTLVVAVVVAVFAAF